MWVVASVITVASFVGATTYTTNRLARLDELSSTLETNAIPSIELLSRTALTYQFILNDRFLNETNTSTDPPQEKNEKGRSTITSA